MKFLVALKGDTCYISQILNRKDILFKFAVTLNAGIYSLSDCCSTSSDCPSAIKQEIEQDEEHALGATIFMHEWQ
jgi:hypothetical protein